MGDVQELLHLQNGSDVRGVALEEKEGDAVTLDGDAVNRIAAAFGLWLAEKTGKPANTLRVGIGHDSRLTADALIAQMGHGLFAQGIQVLDCGLASTPAMFMGTVFPEMSFDGSIMITASHLPRNRNGMKFFTKEGGLDKPDIRQILELAGTLPVANTEEKTAQKADLMQYYAAFLREKITSGAGDGEKPLAGLHIVVDAGNGAGGFYVRQVLQPLGANCEGSQFLEPDGNFPNHQPNPENQQAMESICSAVVRSKADLGIIFDTDVDRMSAVLADGRPINRDTIIAMMSAILAPEYPGATIVTDSVTSGRLTDFLQNTLQLRHHRFKRGYKNVINEAIRLNKEGVVSPLAIETSGHGALKENYFLDDGAYMAVRLIIAAAKAKAKGEELAGLLCGLAPAGVECERRIKIETDDFTAYGKQVLQAFEARAKQEGLVLENSYEGVRVALPDKGWMLLRMSLHDPLLPLNAEGTTKQNCEELLQLAKKLLQGFDKLDVSILTLEEHN